MACDRVAGVHKLYYAPYGADAVTYLGQTGPEGIKQFREYLTHDITSDELGPNAIVDHVYQGQNMHLEFVVQELNKDIVQMFLHPWTNTYTSGIQQAARQEDYGVPGRLGCGVYGVLEAIPAPFTPAQAFIGGSATVGSAATYPSAATGTPNNGRRYKGLVVGSLMESLDNTPRFVPVRFQCYPFDVSGVMKHWQWVTTATASGLTGW